MPTMGALRCSAPGRAEEAGVAVAEDAAVAADQPVAATVVRGRHADDRCVGVRHRVGADRRGPERHHRVRTGGAAAPARRPGAGQAEAGQRQQGHRARPGRASPGYGSPRALVHGVDELAQAGEVEAVEAQGQPGQLGVVVALGREGPGRRGCCPAPRCRRSAGSGRPARPCSAAPAAAAPAGRPPSGWSGSCGRSPGSRRRPPPACWSP